MGDSLSKADSIKKGWEVHGDTDMWELLCKAVNHDTGEYHSTKMLRLDGGGCLIQCDSRTRDGDLFVDFVRAQTYCPSLPRGLTPPTGKRIVTIGELEAILQDEEQPEVNDG